MIFEERVSKTNPIKKDRISYCMKNNKIVNTANLSDKIESYLTLKLSY